MKIVENKKAGSHGESNQGFMAWVASALTIDNCQANARSPGKPSTQIVLNVSLLQNLTATQYVAKNSVRILNMHLFIYVVEV